MITGRSRTELASCDSCRGSPFAWSRIGSALVTGIEQVLAMPKVNTVAREYAERTLEKENAEQFIRYTG